MSLVNRALTLIFGSPIIELLFETLFFLNNNMAFYFLFVEESFRIIYGPWLRLHVRKVLIETS